MEDIFVQYVGEWGWLLLLALISFAFKDTISNFFTGIQFLWGSDFDVDDIVYIRGTKRARIVRQSLWKTTFYVYGHGRKFVVPNKSLWKLDIEKEIMGEEERKFTNDELKLLLTYLKIRREKRSQIDKK